MLSNLHKYQVLTKTLKPVNTINVTTYRKYAFVRKYEDVKEKLNTNKKWRNQKSNTKYIKTNKSYEEKIDDFNLENETYEQNFKEFLKDTAFLETTQKDDINYSKKNNKDNDKNIPLNKTSCVKTIFREFKNFSIYKYTPIDSNALTHKVIEKGEMILEDGVRTKVDAHKYVKSKLDQFLGSNKEGRLTHQKTTQFLRGAGEGWNPKGKKLTVMEMEEIRAMKKEFDEEFASNEGDSGMEGDKPKFNYYAVARSYGVSYEAVKRILATKGHYNKSPIALEKRLARDAKRAIESVKYKVKKHERKS